MMQIKNIFLFIVSTLNILASSALSADDDRWNQSNLTLDVPTWNGRMLKTFESSSMGSQGLCVIGCTPYVRWERMDQGINKYLALVEDMAKTCDIILHLGDTKPPMMECNRTILTKSVHWMRQAAERHGKIALYAPGDNEINDCQRGASRVQENGKPLVIPADFYRASDARSFLVQDLNLRNAKDLTSKYSVDTHQFRSNMRVPGTSDTYSCDFDKYIELDHYAVATVEVPGSRWYLDDQRKAGYPLQNQVDPLKDRLGMYLNAMECTVDWIEQSVSKASAHGKRALFIAMHALFYAQFGATPVGYPRGNFYGKRNFLRYMKNIGRTDIKTVYGPLFDKLTEVARDHPELQIYVIHADGHRFQTLRLNPNLHNRNKISPGFHSNHNLMAQMVEGTSRALTMWTRLTVDPTSFQPVSVKEEWSLNAYNLKPEGHSWVPYSSG
jgi:hypothetical protein